MPMRWDDRAQMILLLKVIGQKPEILSQVNTTILATTWPGTDKPTPRAVVEQIKKIRQQLKAGNFTAPTTPSRSGTSKNTTLPTTRTPNTPARQTTTSITTPSSKRSNETSHHTPNDSASKKRKLARKSEASESEAPELTSSADETGDNLETDDDEPLSLSNAITKRTLPSRSKSRSKSYIVEADSAGEDDCAKDPYSDNDAEFSPDPPAKAPAKKRVMAGLLGRGKQVKNEDALSDESTDDDAGLRNERGEKDSDEESQTTAGKSHQTFVSALEDDF